MSTVARADWPTPNDPFTAAYMALAGALLDNSAFAALVKLGNLNVWCDGKMQTLTAGAQPGDLPSATLVQTQHLLKPWGSTSEVSDMQQSYSLVLLTDSMQVAQINAVKWATMGAIYYAELEEMSLLSGAAQIRDVNVTGGGDGSSGIVLPTLSGDAQRGVNRQGTILNINLSIYAARSTLPT